ALIRKPVTQRRRSALSPASGDHTDFICAGDRHGLGDGRDPDCPLCSRNDPRGTDGANVRSGNGKEIAV
ncbi:MAG: hypothetical protein KAJ05_04590, partial [Candidatus Latescibacteria bacterium]|nr:hypothetical protein [Candidatus Latescibacterota bacterium]